MFKFIAKLGNNGTLYGFGLSETDLNRLEFNKDPIFFDFGYAGHSQLFGLILYLEEFKTPTEMVANVDVINNRCIPFLDSNRGVTVKTLRVFPISRDILKKLRDTPLWAFDTLIEITNPNDVQLFFSGRTEQEIEKHFRSLGYINSQTKQTYKGFEKRN